MGMPKWEQDHLRKELCKQIKTHRRTSCVAVWLVMGLPAMEHYRQHSQALADYSGFKDIMMADWNNYSRDRQNQIRLERLESWLSDYAQLELTELPGYRRVELSELKGGKNQE